MKVLCVGVNPSFDITMVLDGLDDDRVNRVEREHRQAAGKAANVACALAEKGVTAVLTGCFGEETWADWRGLYEKRSSAVELVPVLTPGATRQNITLLTGGKTIKINRAGDDVGPDAAEKIAAVLDSLLEAGDIAVFTGSIPPGMSREQYVAVIRRASDVGARTVVDTDALSESRLLSARPWLYKPNAHELAKLCGVEPGDEQALIREAERLTRVGVGTVLLTLGSRGLAAVTAEETVRVPAAKIEAVNTVGAGDAALAAYIEASLRGAALEDRARAAARAGERAVSAIC